jgi:hypothetical protein
MQITNCRQAAVAASTIGDQTIIAAPGGAGSNIGTSGGLQAGDITVWGVNLEGAGANVLQFKSGATSIGGPVTLTAAGSTFGWTPSGVPYVKCAAGQALVLNLTTTGAITGTLYYTLG